MVAISSGEEPYSKDNGGLIGFVFNGNLGVYKVEITDCNAMISPGNYTCNTATANAPTPFGVLEVSCTPDSGWVYQNFKAAGQTQNPDEYIRANINKVGWSPWVKLADRNDLLYTGSIVKIEFGYDPSGDKCYIAFFHANGYKSLLSFNPTGLYFDVWDGAQWINRWAK